MHRNSRREVFVVAALAAAMWLTRSHQIDDHFGSFIDLPDASWAVFFIAGVVGLRWWAPAALMLNAGVIDYLALLAGVSDYCVTPAYPFLIPTYLTLWASGRWSAFDLARAHLIVAGARRRYEDDALAAVARPPQGERALAGTRAA
jgi:hypothetical protein